MALSALRLVPADSQSPDLFVPGSVTPDPGYPFNQLHSPDPRARWIARVVLHYELATAELVRVRGDPLPLHCPQCHHEMVRRRFTGVLWLRCAFCRLKLGVDEHQEAQLAAAQAGRGPVSVAALLAEWAILPRNRRWLVGGGH